MSEDCTPSTLVLGLGNILCGDDGLGVAALERLRAGFDIPPEVALLDGGTLGLALLPTLEDADEVWILDAVLADTAPGSLVALEGDAVEVALRERLSPHQIGVADLLDALHWRDAFPARLRVLGLVPESIELGIGLSDPVAHGLDGLVEATAMELSEAGHALTPRTTHSDVSPPDRATSGLVIYPESGVASASSPIHR
jgi:hydrogenase maturation protease